MTAFEAIWEFLEEPTREWLIDHNGAELPAPVLKAVRGGHQDLTEVAWLQPSDEGGWTLSDEAIDFVEAFANGEYEGDN